MLLNRDRAQWLSEKKHPLTASNVLDLQDQLKAALHELVNLEAALALYRVSEAASETGPARYGYMPPAKRSLLDEGG